MAVQRLLQSLLVKCMTNQSYGPGEDKEAVQVADLDNIFDLCLQQRVGCWHPKSNVDLAAARQQCHGIGCLL